MKSAPIFRRESRNDVMLADWMSKLVNNWINNFYLSSSWRQVFVHQPIEDRIFITRFKELFIYQTRVSVHSQWTVKHWLIHSEIEWILLIRLWRVHHKYLIPLPPPSFHNIFIILPTPLTTTPSTSSGTYYLILLLKLPVHLYYLYKDIYILHFSDHPREFTAFPQQKHSSQAYTSHY